MISTNVELPIVTIQEVKKSPESITFSITATSSKNKISKILAWCNGVPVFGINGKSIAQSNSISEEITLPIAHGENKLQISVVNQSGVESIRETKIINNVASTEKPNLYFIGLGVSKYKEAGRNLKYADKDIRDLVEVFKAQKGEVYNEVFIDTLINQKVTLNALDQIKTTLHKAGVNDVIILMYAGHGLLSKDYEYFLGTYDVDFMHPDNSGISFEKFENVLTEASSQKKIILLDACHSGEIDKESISGEAKEDEELADVSFRSGSNNIVYWPSNSFDLMKEMFTDTRRGSGAHVISSSSGTEYSQEGKSWGNGVFTYALKSALTENKADEDNNGITTVFELANFLKLEVSELTNETQSPTFRQQNLELNFTIVK
jgi:hypothetical protein